MTLITMMITMMMTMMITMLITGIPTDSTSQLKLESSANPPPTSALLMTQRDHDDDGDFVDDGDDGDGDFDGNDDGDVSCIVDEKNGPKNIEGYVNDMKES